MSEGERPRYAVPFEESHAHQHLVALLDGLPDRGLVLDLGCGYALHAERLNELGFGYAGLDSNSVAVADLHSRGIEASSFDLGHLDGLEEALDGLSAGRPVVAVTAIDVLEHLVEPDDLLVRLRSWMLRSGVGVLGVSIPNVSHQDLAVKLLAGRWDLASTGLLDETHLRFFTATSLAALMTSTGFRESAINDVKAQYGDQHWPLHHPAVSSGTPLGGFVRQVRRQFDQHADTYQFVRLYRTDPAATPAPTLLTAAVDAAAPALSILVDPLVDASVITELLAALMAQTADSIEVVMDERMAPAVPVPIRSGARVVPVAGGDLTLDDLLGAAGGCTVAVVDGAHLPAPEWASALIDAARRAPGGIVCVASNLPAPAAVGFPIDILRGRRWGSGAAADLVGAALQVLAPLCGTTPIEGDLLTEVAGAASLRGSPNPVDLTWDPGVPTLADRGLLAERDALRHRVDELEIWSASIVADNAALNAELGRPSVRVVRRLAGVVRRLSRR